MIIGFIYLGIGVIYSVLERNYNRSRDFETSALDPIVIILWPLDILIKLITL